MNCSIVLVCDNIEEFYKAYVMHLNPAHARIMVYDLIVVTVSSATSLYILSPKNDTSSNNIYTKLVLCKIDSLFPYV